MHEYYGVYYYSLSCSIIILTECIFYKLTRLKDVNFYVYKTWKKYQRKDILPTLGQIECYNVS